MIGGIQVEDRRSKELEEYCVQHWDKGKVTIKRCAECGLNTGFSKKCRDYLDRRNINGR